MWSKGVSFVFILFAIMFTMMSFVLLVMIFKYRITYQIFSEYNWNKGQDLVSILPILPLTQSKISLPFIIPKLYLLDTSEKEFRDLNKSFVETIVNLTQTCVSLRIDKKILHSCKEKILYSDKVPFLIYFDCSSTCEPVMKYLTFELTKRAKPLYCSDIGGECMNPTECEDVGGGMCKGVLDCPPNNCCCVGYKLLPPGAP